jgi:hypothetical protein
VVEELCELMSARYGLRGLKIAVLAIFSLIKIDQIECSSSGKIDGIPNFRRNVGGARKKRLILAQILAHERSGFQVRVGSPLATLYKPTNLL